MISASPRTPASCATRQDEIGDLSLRTHLHARAATPGLRKGLRTGLRIRVAACELLETTGPDRLKIHDLCERAGVSQGTLYLYFADRDDLLATLLQEFVAFLHKGMAASTRQSPSPEDSVRLATLSYCRYFEANRGLMRCLLHHYETFAKARAVVDAWNRVWIETIVRSVRRWQRRTGRAATSTRDLRRRAYALGGMVDQYLNAIYLYQDPNLAPVAGDIGAVADTLTFIWLRAFDLVPDR